MTNSVTPAPAMNKKINHPRYWYLDLLLIIILAAGGYLRFVGIAWDEDQHLHPDERFLTTVEVDMHPVESIGDYFDTATSTLNPHNTGHSFYVYGDFPIILTRYMADWTGLVNDQGSAEYGTVHVLGRQLSASFDMLTILMIFLIGRKLYDRRIGLLASACYSLAAIPIQLSHFFAVDTFAGFFISVAVYAAVSIYQQYLQNDQQENDSELEVPVKTNMWSGIGYYLLFGFGLGMAMSCKISAAPLAIVLPAAVAGWYLRQNNQKQANWFFPLLRNMVIAAAFAFLIFRIFQPYAFTGPGFFGIKPNEKFIANLQEVSGQSKGEVDFPPALQWARRPITFALTNMTLWGVGLPLGIIGWIGVLWMVYRFIKKDWEQHLAIWIWTVAYFGYQSISFNPMMRYTFLIYPTFCLIAAWAIFYLWDFNRIHAETGETYQPKWSRIVAGILLFAVLSGTGAYGYAFSRIYTRPVTRIAATRWLYQNIPGAINFHLSTTQGDYRQLVPYPNDMIIVTPSEDVSAISIDFDARVDGTLQQINFYRIGDISGSTEEKEIALFLTDAATNTQLANWTFKSSFVSKDDKRGITYDINLDQPIEFQADHRYNLRFELVSGTGMVTITGAALANESDWDDGLPLRMDEYDAYGGIYNGDQNFQMYWDDNEEKRTRFMETLDNSDYLLISSNRQWGTTTRVPERYPLTVTYYRNVLGCPEDMDLLVCYAKAEPGMFQGKLGFDLVEVFTSYPNLGQLEFNDTLAEESYTVYDHPKVFIFKKSANYDSAAVHDIFNAVDITRVIHAKLNEVPDHPQDLMLPKDQATSQQTGGTWSEMYNREAFYNKYSGLAVVVWYLVLAVLGLLFQPMVMLAFPGLRDRGYAFGRISALLMIALFSWWAGYVGIAFSRLTITLVIAGLVAVNLILAWLQRADLKEHFKSQSRHILITELVILAFFLIDLGIRIGNPDLWHISKGGEKPMDFAYFNAILKSTSFPPYDPWYAGGYINYYYYGFVIVGVLVKWLGIIPSIAYNLLLPTLFSLLAIGAYTVIYNAVQASRNDEAKPLSPYVFAILAAFGLTMLGNLGTLRMIWYGLQQLVAPGGVIDMTGTNFFTRMLWTFEGLGKFFTGSNLPYNIGEWYWNPSRVIPGEPITEFPFFTFLYADLHAHMIALPITVLIIGWISSLLLCKGKWGSLSGKYTELSLAVSLTLGAVAVGALRPTNTWDFPTYMVLAMAALIYTGLRYHDSFSGGYLNYRLLANRWIRFGAVLAVFAGLALVLYHPFSAWYGAGYTSASIWDGSRTPFWSYLTHWGIFLFIIAAWMVQETIDWMACTPLQKLASLRPYFIVILTAVIVLLAVIGGLMFMGVQVAWLVLILAVWAAILLLRPNQSDIKRMFLFFIGSALFLTLAVELIVLVGDLGRMNTVFKFYLQAWTLFAVTAGAALYWLFGDRVYHRVGFSFGFQSVGWTLALCGMLFTMTASSAKIRDRYNDETISHSLDGMTYMLTASYDEHNINTDSTMSMQLEQDYQGIRWIQDHVVGSPVIVEGSVTEYRWGARYSIYTGLPAVVGWNWHQRQQRTSADSTWVQNRVDEVNEFYNTADIESTLDFIKKYSVKYIIVGQMEQAIYPTASLEKFKAYTGVYWNPVFTYKDTTIYEVIAQE